MVLRRIIFQNMVSVDGFFEGPNQDISWHNVDAEFNETANAFLQTVDLLLFGRKTYELMANYWPKPEALRDDPVIAAHMNRLPKVVASRTLKKVDWNNSKLIKGNVVEEIRKLKQAPGKDIAIFGSVELAKTLIPAGLIDEYRIMVNPVALGKGRPVFDGLSNRLKLKLVDSRTFQNGNVMLCYRPEK